MPPQQTGHPVMYNGLIFGAILGVLGLGNVLLQWATGSYHIAAYTTNGITSLNVTDSGGGTFLLGCVVFLVMLALTFVAGLLTVRRTGKVGSGALAGLITSVVGALIGGIAHFVVIMVFVTPDFQVPADVQMTPGQAQLLIIGITVGGSILGLLLNAGFGAGMGALGGLVGANSYRKMMVGVPVPAYPGYPGYPTYPGYSGTPQPGAAPQPWSYPQPPIYPPQSGNPPPQQ